MNILEVPSDVFVVREIVGFCDVDQHTPEPIVGPPPSFVTTPPLLADVGVINVIEFVVTVGITTLSKGISVEKYRLPLI